MNKITATLAGLALVAGASVAPAFAQAGSVNIPPGTFTFTPSAGSGGTFTAQGIGTYNPFVAGAPSTAAFTLSGTEVGTSTLYNLISFSFSPVGGAPVTELANSGPLGAQMQFTVTPLTATTVAASSAGAFGDGSSFNLVGGAPVPETSTVVSFGALLALGGLALVMRRKGVKNAA